MGDVNDDVFIGHQEPPNQFRTPKPAKPVKLT